MSPALEPNTVGVKWTINGPVIPVELLRAHECGELVLFCGAGVSCPLGLPLFEGLVQKVCEKLGRPMEENEAIEFQHRNYDLVLGLMEQRIVPKGRVRTVVRDLLELIDPPGLATHEALLQLAASKDGRIRLVTTAL